MAQTTPSDLFERYRDLQQYVGWTEEDARRVAAVAELLAPSLPELIDDFYDEIKRHPGAHQVITGGEAQIERLKGTLITWIQQLLAGRYDQEYVERRWRVGWRHVQIGLDQVYTNAALSRLRGGLVRSLRAGWRGTDQELAATLSSLHKLLDLDLAIIEGAYQAEYVARQRQLDRLATVGQVAGGVAHELRQPLNVIQTSIYFLKNARMLSAEKTAEHLQRIESQVERADGVITALSGLARMPAPATAPLRVDHLVQNALETNPSPPSVNVTLDCPANVPAVAADAEQINIVLGNLFRNAYDAMPQGGKLVISGRRRDGTVEIAVRDTGTGIAPDQLHRVMEPLFSTKARGIGLGLAIARAIVEKHKGRLAVESELGRGTTFTLTLPAAGQAGRPTAEPT